MISYVIIINIRRKKMEIQLDVEHFTPYNSKSSQQKKIVGFFIDLMIKKRMTFFPSYDLDHFEGLDTSDYYWNCRVSRS